MKWTSLSICIFYSTLLSCDFTSPGVYTEFSRAYSPDSSRFIVKYDYAQGAWDGGRTWLVSINKATETTGKENNYTLSSMDIDDIYWKGNDTVIIQEKFTEFISQGKSILKDTLFDGVNIKVILKDPIDTSYTKKIIYQETSPNNQYELFVYRYIKPVNGNYFLNISVINKNENLPKFGNFYISRYDFDCFENIKWDSTSALDIRVSKGCYYAFDGYLVKNRPQVKYNVRFDDKDTSRGNIHP